MTMTENSARSPGSAVPRSQNNIRVWDPLIRVFHWGLVAAFAIAYVSAEELSTIHELAGYVVAGLVAFRVIWGLVGSKYARFAQFLRGPAATIGYLGDMVGQRERRYLGHNPAGGLMVIALLATLSGTAFSGWLMEEPARLSMLPELPQFVTPAYADDDGKENWRSEFGEEALEEVHEVFANLMILLIVLHVGGVVLASFRHRENLARAMITGNKRAPGPDDVI